MKIAEEWAVVTGASSGIGLEFSRRLATMGCNLLMISNQADALRHESDAIAAEFGVKTLQLCLDLTAEDCCQQLLGFIDKESIEPLILINNAGIFSFNPVTQTPEGKINAFIELHVRAVTLLSRALGERMSRQRRGYILNMSSMSCWMPMPGLAMYSATKAYIRAFSRSLAYELRDYGVRVMVACPGGIATDLFGLPENLKKLAVNIRVLDTPKSFVKKAINRLLAGKQQYINGMLNRISIVAVGSTPTMVRMMVKHQLLDKNICRP